ncbi:DUF5082 family protein [Halalkalibacterium halodurans]|uniref:BH4015 protein n=1 Tax=Halalkalibacterium halodurans (strain ATCC BAA-125 / DSM 18197 / FERM 7344 / JCM 9153 / C-125) TaxID=272558 RepID=Q9K5S3_HALH5|nr:DUF5082 family protein [Halalkalibacterium halodurans]MED4081080.1 DUF5082 family protein [Halalkalibacterium halodurans]MED4084856.1 DUF5082 family protein [Halalkalibacterium halodurans]MED4103448.1 DUF5082 family protein [Halalkalibacterium halodurans]MED4107776.1 DUF5082 family protein [Halalkalibacterium halodurans]MED4123816.1 DUF5082 family protein [Halalkalibacterium halodurans]
MDYSSKISSLNNEINQLNSVIRNASNNREELAHARSKLLNKKGDLASDARWIHEPENGHDLSRGTIATEHDDVRDSIDHAYAKASEQIEEMIDAIDQERNRLSREIDRTRTMVTSRRDRITTLKAKQRLHDQRGMV